MRALRTGQSRKRVKRPSERILGIAATLLGRAERLALMSSNFALERQIFTPTDSTTARQESAPGALFNLLSGLGLLHCVVQGKGLGNLLLGEARGEKLAPRPFTIKEDPIRTKSHHRPFCALACPLQDSHPGPLVKQLVVGGPCMAGLRDRLQL